MQDVDITEEHATSASVNKVDEVAVEEINDITGNRIMDITILNSLVSCPECFAIDKPMLEDLCSNKTGLASYLIRFIRCGACGYSRHFYSSNIIEAHVLSME